MGGVGVRQADDTPDIAALQLADAGEQFQPYIPLRPSHPEHRSDCSAYDCEFVALAKTLRVPLVTMDTKLLKAFPKLARPFTAV